MYLLPAPELVALDAIAHQIQYTTTKISPLNVLANIGIYAWRHVVVPSS
jgi:hypothetical protein